MISSGQNRLVAFGVVLHALLIYAMFDVHFTSPLVHGIEPVTANFAGPASRLVVIVADGLRADRLFELENRNGGITEVPTGEMAPRAPFLHQVAREIGSWGVSHARPPTESRPGHVALLAGFWEDPSAITKGWQANAVEFDHLLNQSSAAWAIGAPSVVPLFSKGIPHVRSRMYAEELEDFAASNDHAALDEWVFDRAIEVLAGNVTEHELRAGATLETERRALEGDKVVFLLHLLGLDSAGHAHKPSGEGYAENIRVVDAGVRRLAAAFEERFGPEDGGTAFLFTADHGMSNRGAHGDGDPGCTETPIVAWGAGVASTATETERDIACTSWGKDAPTPEAKWGLTDRERCDIEQADLASLGAALLGIPPPIHNAGVLPVSYLDSTRTGLRSGGAVSNAAQLLSVYRRKSAVTAESSLTAYLAPGGLQAYEPLAVAEDRLGEAVSAHQNGRHIHAVDMAQKLARECLDGLTYLHLYDRWLLLGTITACFLGWILFLGSRLVLEQTDTTTPNHGKDIDARKIHSMVAIAVAGVVCAVLAVRRSPVTFYAYFNLPLYFVWYSSAVLSKSSARRSARMGFYQACRAFATVATAVAATQLLCHGFHERIVFSWMFCAASGVLLLLSGWLGVRGWTSETSRDRRRVVMRASAASAVAALAFAALAPFTTFPIELDADSKLVLAGVVCTTAVALIIQFIIRPADIFGDDPPDSNPKRGRPGSALLLVQLSVLCAAGLVVWEVDGLQAAKVEIPGLLHAASWGVAALAAPLPFFSPTRTLPRFTSVYLAAAAVYALFSVSYESLFYAALGVASLAWLFLERCMQKLNAMNQIDHRGKKGELTFASVSHPRKLEPGDIRHAAIFLVLINAAFFGTGNIASVASFEISSVYRFTTRFNPFLMGGLLMLKVLIPMITVAVAFLALLKLQGVPAFPVYLVFVVLSDLMAARFFYQVTTEGSWQDIGMSISRYALMGTQIVLIQVFLGLADLYTHCLPINGVAAKAKIQ